ncbi:MAG: hypothetical protein QW461_02450 [Candidatus Jordarchaeales archaeon]
MTNWNVGLKGFAASLLGKGDVKVWSKDELNAALILFSDVLAKLLLLGSMLPILLRTDYLPAWYFSTVTGIYNAPFTLFGMLNIHGVQIPTVIQRGDLIPPDFQIYAPHIPWTLVSAFISSSVLATLIGGIAYSYYAYAKTVKTGSNFTALPFGPSLPATFLVIAYILIVVRNLLGLDIYTAVSVAIMVNIVCSITEVVLALTVIGRVKGRLPLPGVLGVSAGIGVAWAIVGLFSFVAGTPVGGVCGALNNWPQISPVVGLVTTALLLGGLVLRQYSRVPPALAALAVGAFLASLNALWLGVYSATGDLLFYFREVWTTVFGGIGPQFLLAYLLGINPAPYVYYGISSSWLPSIRLEILGRGLEILPLVAAIAVPIQVYDTVESYANTMSCNLALARRMNFSGGEAEKWAYEEGYDPSDVMLVGAFASLVGALFGGWAPMVNYVGSAGYVRVGARVGYPVLASLLLAVVTWIGVFYLIPLLLPISVTAPFLLFLGGITVAQAFMETYEYNGGNLETVWGDFLAVCLAVVPQIFLWTASVLTVNFSFLLTGEAMSAALSPYRLLNEVFYFTCQLDGLIVRVPYAKLLGVYGYSVNPTFSYASLALGWSGVLFFGLNASLVGLVWGSIFSDVNHRKTKRAAAIATAAAVLSVAGVMHSFSVPLNSLEVLSAIPWGLFYLAMAVLILLIGRRQVGHAAPKA